MQDPIYYFEPNAALSWRQARLEGPDALDFLQRITSVDVKNLAPGGGTPACILDAQGRFRSFFWLWRMSETEFLFEMEGGPEDRFFKDFLAVIEQFTFAEKMKLSTPEAHAVWVFGAPDAAFNHGAKDFGREWVTFWNDFKPQAEWVRADLDLIESWRVQSLSPRPGFEIGPESNPLELGLVRAVADQKGCYPGQEVIEKVFALGAPARRLILLQISGEEKLTSGTDLMDSGQSVGKLTSIIPGPTNSIALALVRKTHAQVGKQLQISGSQGKGVVLKVAPYAKP